jgi:hypothetical protein
LIAAIQTSSFGGGTRERSTGTRKVTKRTKETRRITKKLNKKRQVIPSCAQVEGTEKSGEVIFHFKDAPHPARFGRTRLRATKRSALAAVAQHLLGPAAAPYRAGSWSGHGELFSFF